MEDCRKLSYYRPQKMSSNYKDYYSTLGIDKSASQDEIKKGFRKIARKFHPDVAGSYNQEASDAKFKEANEAYEVLGDPEKRKRYDDLGANWQQAGTSPSYAHDRSGAGESGNTEFNFKGTGFSDFFEQYFAGGSASDFEAAAGSHRGFSIRGSDVEAELSVSFEEVLHGSDRTVSLSKMNPRTGEKTSHKYQVKIPKGIREGQRIRLTGQGAAGSGSGISGDLFLRVRYASHPFLRNDKQTLYYDLEIAPWEAVLGASILIRSLDGSVRVKVPPCSQNQKQLKLRELGLPLTAGGRGDLYIRLSIEVPNRSTIRSEALGKLFQNRVNLTLEKVNYEIRNDTSSQDDDPSGGTL
jgi:curved DNA-binding protein